MRNNSNNNKNISKSSARLPATRQGASANTSLAERREKAVIRLPEERRKGTKYQVIRGQYLRQANKKETSDSTNADAIKKAAAKQVEKQEKAKRQTMAAKDVKDEKEKGKTSSRKVSHENNETNAVSEAKDEYAKSTKAEEYAERLQTNIDLSKAVNIPPSVTWDQVIDNSVKKDSVYSQGGSAQERTLQYKEKADFYLNKMKKNTETRQKEVNPNRDKDIGALYKRAYKLAHKEELLDKKNSTLFEKGQSAIQLKSEVDNALNKDNMGEAVAAAAAIPVAHAATKAIRKLADKSNAVNAGKTGFELAAKVTAGIATSDSVGEATANAVVAVPKYVVEKKVEKTVRQVIQDQHDRKVEAQRERLRKQQEKVEKRAQDMRKDNMQRKLKTELYKSEHGITSSGNNILKNAKAAIKNALEAMKRAVTVIYSLPTYLMAISAGALIPLLFVGITIIITLILVVFPFIYTSSDGDESNIENSTFSDTILHYYDVIDEVIDNANAEIQEFQDSYVPPEDGPNFEGFVWDDETDGEEIPKGNLYDEMLCTISTYNDKLMTRPETVETESGSNNIIFMNDKSVAEEYANAGFWEFTYWEESVPCSHKGCRGHYIIKLKLTFDFDLDKVWDSYNFDEEDKKKYDEVKENFDNEKKKAEESGISFERSEDENEDS